MGPDIDVRHAAALSLPLHDLERADQRNGRGLLRMGACVQDSRHDPTRVGRMPELGEVDPFDSQLS